MAAPKYPGFDTLALHAGQSPDPATGSRAVPVHQTTSYVFRDTEHAASLFNMERAGHVYSRISNPTVAVLEERISALEGGVGAVATASGQAALHLAVATLMGAGSHIVASGSLYGGSHNLLGYTLKRFGIDTTFVSPRDPDNFKRACTDLLLGFPAVSRPRSRQVHRQELTSRRAPPRRSDVGVGLRQSLTSRRCSHCFCLYIRPGPIPSAHGSLSYDGTALGAHWTTSNVCPDCITHEVSPRLSPEHVQPAGALGVVVVVLNTETASGQPVL